MATARLPTSISGLCLDPINPLQGFDLSLDMQRMLSRRPTGRLQTLDPRHSIQGFDADPNSSAFSKTRGGASSTSPSLPASRSPDVLQDILNALQRKSLFPFP